MRNIILSLVMVAVLVAGGVGGTLARWVEADTGDYCWTAGSLNLKIDIGGIGFPAIDLDDVDDLICESGLEPGSFGEETLSFHIDADPSSGHYVTLSVTGTCDNKENGRIEPEETAGDTTPGTPGVGLGELDDFLLIKLWCDDGDNIFDLDEHDGLIFYGTFAELVAAASIATIEIDLDLDVATVYYLGVEWVIADYGVTYFDHFGPGITPSPTDEVNQCMTDSLSGTVTFTVTGPIAK